MSKKAGNHPCGPVWRIALSLKKRGKYWNYEFMLHGQRYWGSTKETVKSRANTFLSLLIANLRDRGANPQLKRPPTLQEFAVRFLEFINAETAADQLDPDTKRYYTYGWKLLQATSLASMPIDQISRSDAAVIKFDGSPSYTNQAFRTLRRMLNLAVEWRIMRAAPKIKTVEEHGRTALIESAQETLLLDVAPQPLADILTIIMDAGLRP
jgi:hypothetical protein